LQPTRSRFVFPFSLVTKTTFEITIVVDSIFEKNEDQDLTVCHRYLQDSMGYCNDSEEDVLFDNLTDKEFDVI